jgi:anti-sigma-K factor RskA
MAESDRLDAAAEYALGTLDAAERLAFEAEMARDPALAQEVAAWQKRLGALSEETDPVVPPPDALGKILTRLGGTNVIDLSRRLAVWRGAAIGAGLALAASLVLFLAGPRAPQHAAMYVAVLQGGDAKPAFVAAVDVASKTIVVRRVAAGAPDGHSYELWVLGAGRTAPQPLGVVEAVAHLPADQLGALGDQSLGSTIFAVSLEPPGGSPTGQPTGPVLFTGKLLSAK